MDAPRIHYTTAADGVRLAYWVMGSGPLLLHMPPAPWSHLEEEWRDPAYAAWYKRLAQVFQVAHYDARGSGLSDRDLGDLTDDDYLLDLDAIAGRLGWEQFALLGVSTTGGLAMQYAATRPDRLTRLILWDASLHYADASPDVQALSSLASSNWKLYTETVGRAMVAGWDEGEAGAHWGKLMFASATQADATRFFLRGPGSAPALSPAMLSGIHRPTLVLHRKASKFTPTSEALNIAAAIPDAELVLLEGEAVLPYVGEADAVHNALEEFMGVQPSKRTAPGTENPPPDAESVRTILFTDIESHTAMMASLGDDRGRDLLREHERLTRDALSAHGGREVKTLGDGFMASFGSAQRAVACAIALQRSLDAQREAYPEHAFSVRIGLNAGEPIAENDDLFGTSVITAARIAHMATGGEILAADVVRQLVAGKGFLFSDTGEHLLKGLEDPVRIWRIRWSADET